MIPKIIHYVWLGSAPIPQAMQECMDTWRQKMPDYKIMEWNESMVQDIDDTFIREAIQEKKWAFASDVIRLYAIYKYGGIYMDTDVKVYKSFDSLLENHAFIGRENSMHIIGHSTINYLTTCCFGAEPGNPFIERCLTYYNGRHFITSADSSLPADLRLDMQLNSEIFCKLASAIGYKPSVLADTLQKCENDVLTIYPKRCFDAVGLHPDTYSKHLALGTWREGKRKEYSYSFSYKIKWRIRAVVEKILRRYNYVMVKLK